MVEAFTGRTRKIKSLKGIYKQSLAYLRNADVAKRSKEYNLLVKKLDIPTYLTTLANALQSFNIPEIGVSPKSSANAHPKYEGKLPLYGALVVSLLAPKLIKRLEEVGESKIHIEEATELMDDYNKIALAHMTYSLDKAAENQYRKKQSVSGRKGGKKTPLRSELINPIIDNALGSNSKISSKEVMKQVEARGIQLTESEVNGFSDRVTRRRKKLISTL